MGEMTTHPFDGVTHVATLGADLGRLGAVFQRFEDQDSGCVSYGVLVSGKRWFVKGASAPQAVRSLERAVAFHRSVKHPAIVPMVDSFVAEDGMVLVYPWMSGEVLYHPTLSRRGGRGAPGSPMARFRAQPVSRVLDALGVVLSAHVAVEEAGFVAVDFYDGCMLYDFDEGRMVLCDLDEYRAGAFVVEGERLPGSTRYMAPEEFVRGAVIDVRTNVFVLGRVLRLLLDGGDEERDWRGTAGQLEVIGRATAGEPGRRYGSVRELAGAWRAAG
jgi:serine/threonine-protein kinase